jgi:hypothetical protein
MSDMTQLRLESCPHDDRVGSSFGDDRPGVSHVEPVSQCGRSLEHLMGILMNGKRFAGEKRLIDLEIKLRGVGS